MKKRKEFTDWLRYEHGFGIIFSVVCVITFVVFFIKEIVESLMTKNWDNWEVSPLLLFIFLGLFLFGVMFGIEVKKNKS